MFRVETFRMCAAQLLARRTSGWLLLVLAAALVGGTAVAALRRFCSSEVRGTVELRGEVRTKLGAAVLPDALVRLKATPHVTRTNSQGQFVLRVPEGTLGQSARVTAWKEGYYIGGAAASPGRWVVLLLEPLPREDHQDYRWIPPDPSSIEPRACGNCHEGIYREWVVSAHGQSARNRHFLDIFYGRSASSERRPRWAVVRDIPESRAVCAACHVPSVDLAAPEAWEPGRAKGVVAEGIHCDLCHKVRDLDVQRVGLQHGAAAFAWLRPPPGKQVFFGPLDDVDRGEDTYTAVYRESRYCAPCHEGTLFGVRVYQTYTEWGQSSYGRKGVSCQQCHMKPTGRRKFVAESEESVMRNPWTLSTHHFGANQKLETLRRAMDVEVEELRVRGQQLGLKLALRTVEVGHCLPTGFPDRHLLLVVEARDADGHVLPLVQGPVLPPEAGFSATLRRNVVGLPGRLFGRLLVDFSGVGPAPFWLAVAEKYDTRLRPDQTERVEFWFHTSGARGVAHIEVSLLYRRFYPELVEEKGWELEEWLVHQLRRTTSFIGALEGPQR
jgi:hypothetical protein